MQNNITYRDSNYMRDCLRDQDCFHTTIEIKRCSGLNKNVSYPGAKAELIRRSIYTRAEIKPITLGEVENSGGNLIVGDLEIRCDVELRGGQVEDYHISAGDKIDPDLIADVVKMGIPYQGEWYVIGIPEPAQIKDTQGVIFWNVNIRRIKTGSHG